MHQIQTIADFAPEPLEAGVGLALQDEAGRYLFFLAGKRHRCPPGELFYAGIGGHREPGEDWLSCAQREAMEETGSQVRIQSSPTTWHLSQSGQVRQVELSDRPRPLALYEMIHPPGTPRTGELYRIVIYRARLLQLPKRLPEDELSGVIALSETQVIQGARHKSSLGELLRQGAEMIAGGQDIDRKTRLYPIGTALALAKILDQISEA